MNMQARLLTLLLLLLPVAASAQMTYQTAEPAMTPKKRELYFYGLRSYPFGKIPQNARLNAILQTNAKMRPFGGDGVQSVNSWKSIGPNEVGGRVTGIAVHPTDGKTLWIATADGGVWKSTDRGDSWTAVLNDENAIAIGAIAVDPNDPNTLYAGTGEMSSNADAYSGAGVFKSTDGGSSWSPMGLTSVGAFSKIAVHPKNSNLVIAAATKNNGGVYRSTDGGATWARTFGFPASDVVVNPKDENQVWIGTMTKGIYRSVDGGKTFTPSSADISPFGSSVGRISLAISPTNPTILYALTTESEDGTLEIYHSRIYRSSNSGANWVNINNDDPTNFMSSGGNDQGWYNQSIAVSPTSPNTVIAGGVSIVKTTNANNTDGVDWYFINTYATFPHPDQHAVAFDPTNPNRIYAGCDGGMYRSEDAGQSFESINKGLAITQFYAMAVDLKATDRIAYGGAQDNGTISTRSTTYGDLLTGDGGYVAVDPENSNIVYCETQEGRVMARVDLATGDKTPIMNGIPSDGTGIPTELGAWAAPIAIDPQNHLTLWHSRHYVYNTLDGGDLWFRVADNAVFNGLGSAIGISPASSEVVFAGSDRGELLVTTDAGESWANRSRAQGMPNRAITDLVGSRTDPKTFYMAVSGFYTSHVFKTTDYGASWKSISAGLPDIPVNALAIHPDDENIIYAGSDIGMFITTDGGESWATYNNGLPRVAVADLEVHKKSNTLVMASHGRSMWEISLEKPTIQPSVTSPAGGEIWMGGTGQLISWAGFSPGPVIIEFSLDNGTHWQKLKDNVTGNAFRWSLFDTAVSYARIRVTSMGTAGQVATSRTFTITNYTIGGLLNTNGVTATPYGIAFDGEYLWSTDWGSKTLLKLDPNTLQTVAVLTMNLPKGMDSLFTDIAYLPTKGHFVINKLNNTVETNPGGIMIEIDKSGNLIGQWTSPCAYPIGLAWLGGPHSSRQQLLVTDRNRDQKLFFYNPDDLSTPVETKDRPLPRVLYGPRGATQGPDGKTFYQAITDFSGGSLQATTAEKMKIEGLTAECSIPLTSPFVSSGTINARGIEFDPRDSNIWVSDFGGNVYKMVSCDSRASIPHPPAADAPSAPAATGGMTLSQNSPNPFSGTTSIRFTLPSPTGAQITVYDATGKLVATVASGRFDAGEHVVEFAPTGLPSGVYRYSLTLENGATKSGTMVYLK